MTKTKPVVVFIGTYPPRECGIATFNQDLLHSTRQFLGPTISCKVAALNLSPLDTHKYPPEVAWQINQKNSQEYSDFAKELNQNSQISGVILQHEYGIFGGNEGENILSFLEVYTKPILITLHTVLPTPSPTMKQVTARIVKRANIIVVLTHNSQKILENLYPDSQGKVYVIPHGIHPTIFSDTKIFKKKLKLQNSTVISTFGLLSPGKGIEAVIQALPQVVAKYPSLVYLILGQTHPAVRRSQGETYRNQLAALIAQQNLGDHVKFYDQYLTLDDLLEFLKATDIYIATSTDENQAVSGTLSYALGTGRAVISTEFAQAKEIVSPTIGRLVPIKDSPAITAALLDLLSDPVRLTSMHQHAYTLTRPMLWSNVAKDYYRLLTQAVLPPINLSHLHRMTDNTGLFQFAHFSTPDKSFGYTLDDNARALIATLQILATSPQTKGVKTLISTYLNFISLCQQPNGSFLNYLSYSDKSPTHQNFHEDISDATARTIWALGEAISSPHLNPSLKQQAIYIFQKSLPHLNFPHLRSKAITIKGLALVHQALPDFNFPILNTISTLAQQLTNAYDNSSSDSWHWFENNLSYNNGVLPEALLISGYLLNNPLFKQIGLDSLNFLIAKTFTANSYSPIGHSQWFFQDKTRSFYDQQPEDPCSTILALVTAYQLTHQKHYKNLANKCFSWFLCNNSLSQSVYDYSTGGCYDGLHPDRHNQNQGAESLVSYLLSRNAVAKVTA